MIVLLVIRRTELVFFGMYTCVRSSSFQSATQVRTLRSTAKITGYLIVIYRRRLLRVEDGRKAIAMGFFFLHVVLHACPSVDLPSVDGGRSV